MSYDITHHVDRVVRELRNPQHSNKQRLLQEAVYYLPSLRNEHNIPLLAYEIVTSPLYAGDVEWMLTVSDAIRAACTRKFEISDPTIPSEEWVYHLVFGTYTLLDKADMLWKALPLLAGLILATHFNSSPHYKPKSFRHIQRQQHLLVSIANSCLINPHDNSSSSSYHDPNDPVVQIASFMLARTASVLDSHVFNQIAFEALPTTLAVVYQSRHALRGIPSPDSIMFKNLSSFSNFIKRFIEERHPCLEDIDETINRLASLTDSVSAELTSTLRSGGPLPWQVIKPLYFAVVLQLQGIVGALLHCSYLPLPNLSAKILKTLFPVNFIIKEMGLFEAYSFVYHICVDILLEHGPSSGNLPSFISFLAGSCNPGAVTHDAIMRSKAVFVLDLYEILMPIIPGHSLQTVVIPFTNEFLQLPPGTSVETFRPVLESAHSVMLAYFSLMESQHYNIHRHHHSINQGPQLTRDQIMGYFEVASSLFPNVLSGHQYTLTVKAIAKAITSPAMFNPAALDWFLNSLYTKAKTSQPGVMLTKKPKSDNASNNTNGQDDESGESDAPTVRSVVVGALIHTLPLLNKDSFPIWLDRCDKLVPRLTYAPGMIAEYEYLQKQLQDMVSLELDLTLADQGITWWFTKLGKI